MTHHREKFIDAIDAAASIAGDETFGRESSRLFRDLEDDLTSLLVANDEPSLAFRSLVPVDTRNQTAITALLGDRLVVGWRSGRFRKRFGSLVLPYSAMRGITSRDVARDPSLGGHPTITIETDRPVVIAIPAKKSPLLEAVRDAIVDEMGYQRG